jgi:hypothetical protein
MLVQQAGLFTETLAVDFPGNFNVRLLLGSSCLRCGLRERFALTFRQQRLSHPQFVSRK